MGDPAGERSRRFEAAIAERHVMSLATGAGGDVWAATVFYAERGLDLIFLSSPASRHARNLARRAWAAATIDIDDTNWRRIRGLQLEGPVTLLEGDRALDALAVYVAKFPWVERFRIADRRHGVDVAASAKSPPAVRMEIGGRPVTASVYVLSPSRLVLTDNRVGFGHRDVLEVPRTEPR